MTSAEKVTLPDRMKMHHLLAELCFIPMIEMPQPINKTVGAEPLRVAAHTGHNKSIIQLINVRCCLLVKSNENRLKVITIKFLSQLTSS